MWQRPCTFYRPGAPVCLMAPHAVNQTRHDGQHKLADLFTGNLARDAAERTAQASSLVFNRQSERWSQEEFWFAMLEVLPKNTCVLDLHGAASHWTFDVCFGTGRIAPEQHPWLPMALALAEQFGLHACVNEPFSGRQGLTAIWQAYGGQALQVELHHRLRDYNGQPLTVKNTTLPFLKQLAEALALSFST